MGARAAQKGSAFVYILVAVALLGLLTATFMGSSEQNQSGEKTFKLVQELGSQITTLRSAVQECVLTYPAGDTNMPAAPALVGGHVVNRPYPLQVSNSYLLNPAAGVGELDKLRCPGNPGNSNDHARMFAGKGGKFLPPVPDLTWRAYYNGPDGVFLQFGIWTTDAYLKTALDKIDAQYAPCEADVIDARSMQKTISSNGWTCDLGQVCLRVWFVMKPTAMFPDEPGCPPP